MPAATAPSKHLLKESYDMGDVMWCGASSGAFSYANENYGHLIKTTTCRDCLEEVIEYGKKASERLAALGASAEG